MYKLRNVSVILVVMLFFSSQYLNTIIPRELDDDNDKKLAPSSSWGFQSGKSTSGLSSSSSSTQQVGDSQTYSTSFSKSMDIESRHRDFNRFLEDTCKDWGYEFESELYIDYNLKIKHSGSSTIESSSSVDEGSGNFILTQTNIQSSYEVTVRPEIVFNYYLRVFETHDDCYWPFDDPSDYPDKVFTNTLRIPFPSLSQEFTGQSRVHIPNLGYVYLWDSDATVPGINQPSSTTGFMLDERISVSTIDIYPIIQKYFSSYTDPIDYWVDVSIPLQYNLDIVAQAQHAIEYAMSIDGGGFLGMNDVMRLSSDPRRIFGSDLTNPGTTASKQWVGDGGDVRISATPNLVYHIHAEVTGSISVSMLVTTMSEWITVLDLGPYTLHTGTTQTDSYSKVTNAGPTITYSSTKPLLGITEFELFGQNVTPITAISSGASLIFIILLLSILTVSKNRQRKRKYVNLNSSRNIQLKEWRKEKKHDHIPYSDRLNMGQALNWDDPFNPMNNQLLEPHNQNEGISSTVGKTQMIWDANLQQWDTIRYVGDYTQLPSGGNYVNDEQGTHYYTLDGGDWLLLNDGSFTLLPNKMNVNPINKEVQNQIETEDNHSLNIAEHQVSTPFTVEWMEYPLASGNWWYRENSSQEWTVEWMEYPLASDNWWYRENSSQEWNLWDPQTSSYGVESATSSESSSIQSMEHPEGSGNWWDWNAVRGEWELLENHVSEEGDISITSDFSLGDYKEYPLGSGIWWSWNLEKSEWQQSEKSFDLVEKEMSFNYEDSTINDGQFEINTMNELMMIDDLIENS